MVDKNRRTLMALQKYRDFQPTGLDEKGLNLPDQQDWLVSPVLITRDTPTHDYTLSNWHVIQTELARLDPDHTDHEACSFNHWGPGWFEILIVKPESPSHTYLEETAKELDAYPILDEADYQAREHAAACDDWACLPVAERVKAIAHSRANGQCVSTFSARSEELPRGITWETHSDGIYFW